MGFFGKISVEFTEISPEISAIDSIDEKVKLGFVGQIFRWVSMVKYPVGFFGKISGGFLW